MRLIVQNSSPLVPFRCRQRTDGAGQAGYHPRDDRTRHGPFGRSAGLPLRRLRGRPGRALRPTGPPSPLLRRGSSGAARHRPPGGVLPVECVRGLPDLPGLGAARGRSNTGRRRGAVPPPGATVAMSQADDHRHDTQAGRPPEDETLRGRGPNRPPNGRDRRRQPSGRDDDGPAPMPPRRNPPRDWAAPPPWATGPGMSSGAGRPERPERRPPPGGWGGRRRRRAGTPPPQFPADREARGLAGSTADRVAGGEVVRRAAAPAAGRGARAATRGARRSRPSEPRNPTPSSPVSSGAARPSAPPSRTSRATYGDDPGQVPHEGARPPSRPPTATRTAPRRGSGCDATRPTRRSGSARRCPACRGSPSWPARSASPRSPCSCCRRCSAIGGRWRAGRRHRDAERRCAIGRRRRRPSAPAPTPQVYVDQAGRHAVEDREALRHHDRRAARGQHGRSRTRTRSRSGQQIIIPVPAEDRGRGGPSGATARQRRSQHAATPPRASAGAMLIAVIWPASTRNVASMCWLWAPGRTTSRSAS